MGVLQGSRLLQDSSRSIFCCCEMKYENGRGIDHRGNRALHRDCFSPAKGDLPKPLILLSFKRIMNPTLGRLLLSHQPTAIIQKYYVLSPHSYQQRDIRKIYKIAAQRQTFNGISNASRESHSQCCLEGTLLCGCHTPSCRSA